VLAQETPVSVGLNGDSKVTESLTTYAQFWLGRASNSKTGMGNPVQVQVLSSAPTNLDTD